MQSQIFCKTNKKLQVLSKLLYKQVEKMDDLGCLKIQELVESRK